MLHHFLRRLYNAIEYWVFPLNARLRQMVIGVRKIWADLRVKSRSPRASIRVLDNFDVSDLELLTTTIALLHLWWLQHQLVRCGAE